jgi:hypothetical protein
MPDNEEKEITNSSGKRGSDRSEHVIQVPWGSQVDLTIIPVDDESGDLNSRTGSIQLKIKVMPPTTGVGFRESKTFLLSPRRWVASLNKTLHPTVERFVKSPAGSLLRRAATSLRQTFREPGMTLLLLSIGVYLFTYLYRLEDFPIFFFTDEAIQTVLASDLIRDGLHDYHGTYLPTFFLNGSRYALSLSVYMQLLPTLLLPRSIMVTRAVATLVSSTSVLAVAMTLKRIFQLRSWWIGVLLLGLTPAWFLHARTAFEYGLLVTNISWALYFYLRYRQGDTHYLYLSIVFASLGFYSYNPGQLIIPGLALLLLALDARYHWQHKSTVIKGLGLALLCMLPYLRFRLEHPIDSYHQLKVLNSYWVQPTPFGEKISHFLGEFLLGLSPKYWFFPGTADLIRHVMKGYGHIQTLTLPFAALGLVIGLKKPHRKFGLVLLAAMLASVLGGAVVAVGISRVLSFIIPMTIFIAIGVDWAVTWISSKLSNRVVLTSLFIILACGNVLLMRDALINGPTWFTDYSLGGMQYGAKQVSAVIQSYIDENPDSKVILSPDWANGVDVIRRFFFPDDAPVYLGSAASFTGEKAEVDDHTLLVMTPEEYAQLQANPKIGRLDVEFTLTYPDWKPGFYFLKMEYSDEADEIFEQERTERLKPRSGSAEVLGQVVQIEHPYFDNGEIQHMFDHDTYTLARVYEANPATIKITFPDDASLEGMRLTTGSMDFELDVRLYTTLEVDPVVYHQSYQGLPDDPTVQINFDLGPERVRVVEVEILSIRPADPVKIHIRELTLY